MKSRTCIQLIACFAMITSAFACRIIIDPPHPPHPHPRPWPIPRPPELQPMEVRYHHAEISLGERFAEVTVNATFYNPNNQRIEGTYIFPISPEAAVSSFSMTVNGKTMEAELLPADKARAIYENIVRQMRDPALLEYMEQGLLKARVFPIEPRSEVKITLTYEQHLRSDGGITRFAYPLLSARPEGNGTIKQALIDVTLKTENAIKTLYTPGFDTRIVRDGNNRARLTWEASSHTPARDFEIVFSTSRDKIGIDFLSYRKGGDGYFIMFLAPNSELQAEEIAAKDIIFVVDTSGSMNGEKIKQARQALRYCIDNLSANDYFNIVGFATDVNPLAPQPLQATPENLQKARDFIESMRARGGTAIDDALAFAVSQQQRQTAVPLIVFLTDGLPTIGEVEPKQILTRLDGKTIPRIFTFGVGDDVHTLLLDSMANRSGGYPTYVRPQEDLELALTSFYERVASPVMSGLQLDTAGVRLEQMMPKELPDLFRGGQATVVGRYKGTGTSSFTLSGEVGGVREKFLFEANLDGDSRNSFIPRLWAIRRVGHLEESIRLHGKNQELIDEIKLLGREYGIITPYTSFLVVEEGMAVHERQGARRELQMLEDRARAEAPSGAGAVDAAQSSSTMKHAETTAPSMQYGFQRGRADADMPAVLSPRSLQEIVRQVDDKTFYYRHDVGAWFDSLIPAGQSPKVDQTVTAWSDAFFELIRQHPRLRQYLQAELPLVIQLQEGLIIRIEK